MFHTGLRKMFLNRDAMRLIPPERLRWIAFGHFEADECGAMNKWLAAAPQAKAAHGGCMVSLNDFADRPPRLLNDGETHRPHHPFRLMAGPHCVPWRMTTTAAFPIASSARHQSGPSRLSQAGVSPTSALRVCTSLQGQPIDAPDDLVMLIIGHGAKAWKAEQEAVMAAAMADRGKSQSQAMLIRNRGQVLGAVEASNEQAAKQVAAERFNLTDYQLSRLALRDALI
jgi:hypothetical protein